MRGPGVARLGLIIGVCSAMACAEADQPPVRESEPATATVELFGEGAISTEAPEFATTFSLSGDTVWFNRTPPDRSRLDLFFAVRSGSGWSAAMLFPPLEGVVAIDPFVSLDGQRLYFSSDLVGAGTQEGSFNLWWIPLGDDGAGPVAMPGPVNSDSSDVFNSFARDGRMVFSSRRDGYRAIYEVVGGEVALVPLGADDDRSASNPAIHPDGELLVFASGSGDDPPDLFVSCRTDGEWGAPARLPEPINSAFTDFAPGFGPGFLYFTSERPGVVGAVPDGVRPPGDVYRTPVEHVERVCAEGA